MTGTVARDRTRRDGACLWAEMTYLSRGVTYDDTFPATVSNCLFTLLGWSRDPHADQVAPAVPTELLKYPSDVSSGRPDADL